MTTAPTVSRGAHCGRSSVLVACYFGMLVIGIAMTTIGPTLPLIISDLGLSLGLAGTILSGRAVGRLAGTPLGGFLSDRWGRKPVILVGSALMTLGLAATATWPGKLPVVFWSFIVGMGIGHVDGSINALVADLSAGRRGFGLNMLHVFFGVGALLGPIGAGLALDRWANWHVVMYAAACACLLFGGIIACQPIPAPIQRRTSAGRGPSAFKLLLSDSLILMLAAVMFCYGGTGFGITGWVNSYLSGVLAFTALASSSVLSLYSVGLTAGRVVCSFVADRLGFPRLLAICALGSFASMGLAVATKSGPVTVAGFCLTGFFFSGLFPTSVAYGSSRYPDRAGAVAGTLISMNNLGAILIPLAMGALADAAGLQVAMRMAWGVLWVLGGVGLVLLTRSRRAASATAQ